MAGKGPQAKARNSIKAAKRKETRFAAMLVTPNGSQLETAQLAAAYKSIYGKGHLQAMEAAYPLIFPQYIPSVGIA